MITIELNKKFYSVPAAWNELSRRQFIRIMKILGKDGDSDPYKIVVSCFRVLCGMSWWKFAWVKAVDIDEFLYLIEFLFTKQDLTKTVLTEYKGCYGPADNFNNLRASEYVFTEDFYQRYKQDESNEDMLNNLVAVLYRPKPEGYDIEKNEKGDTREEFNENLCAYRAKTTVRKWPRHVKEGILLWYESCRLQMIRDYPKVFNGEGGEPARYGLVSVLRSVAQGKTFGDFKNVENTYLKMIMMELDEMKAETEKIK